MALGKEQHRKKQEARVLHWQESQGMAQVSVPLDQEHSVGAATSSAAVKSHVSMWQDKAGDQGQLLEHTI